MFQDRQWPFSTWSKGEEEQRRESERWKEQKFSVKKGLLWAKRAGWQQHGCEKCDVVTPTAMAEAKETAPREDHRCQQLREPVPSCFPGAGRAFRGRTAEIFPLAVLLSADGHSVRSDGFPWLFLHQCCVPVHLYPHRDKCSQKQQSDSCASSCASSCVPSCVLRPGGGQG